MKTKDIKKKYTNGEMTIVWQPAKCIHSEVCVHTLPQVYHPRDKPWITMENASTENMIAQVKQCPSGALSYYMNKDGEPGSNQQTDPNNSVETISIVPNGPYLIKGKVNLERDGKVTEQDGPTTALCRCGGSGNKPYCDGSHSKIDFVG